MPRIVPLLSGLALATAVTYKFGNDLQKDQNNIKSRLSSAKSTLEKAVTEEPYSRGPSYLTDSQKYVSDRLVPSGIFFLIMVNYDMVLSISSIYSQGFLEQSNYECITILSQGRHWIQG